MCFYSELFSQLSCFTVVDPAGVNLMGLRNEIDIDIDIHFPFSLYQFPPLERGYFQKVLSSLKCKYL